MRSTLSLRALVVTMTLATMAGCGLLDLANFKSVKFDLPKQSFTVGSNDSRWKVPPTGVPNVTCGPGGVVQDCCSPPPPAAAVDCVRYPLTCEAGQCSAKVPLEQVSTINLADQVPALKEVKGQIIGDILLKYLELEIRNGFNVPLPPVQLYVGPESATGAASPGTHLLATIESKPVGYNGTERIDLSTEAQQAFSGFAKDFQTPFKIIMSTTFVVNGKTPPPQGDLMVTVGGQVEAKL